MIDIRSYDDSLWPEACKTWNILWLKMLNSCWDIYTIDATCKKANNQCQKQDCSYIPFEQRFGDQNPAIPGSKLIIHHGYLRHLIKIRLECEQGPMNLMGSTCYCNTRRYRNRMVRDEQSRQAGAFTLTEYLNMLNGQSRKPSRPGPGRESYEPGSSRGSHRQGDTYKGSQPLSWSKQKEQPGDSFDRGRGTFSGHERTPANYNDRDYYENGRFYREDGRRPM